MELRPCPFDGNKDVCLVGLRLFYVACNKCATHGPIAETRDEAIAAWNRRADKEEP